MIYELVLGQVLVQALEHAIIACGDYPKKDPQIHWPATPESVLRAIYTQRGDLYDVLIYIYI